MKDIKVPPIIKNNAITIVVVVLVAVLLISLLSGGFSKFVSWIGGLINNSIQGIGGNVTPTSAAGQADISQLTTIENWITGNAGNFLEPDMYVNSPDDASISQTQATSLYSDVWAASDPGIFISHPDFTGVLGLFQQTVQNQTDISFVSKTIQDAQGNNLEWMLVQKFAGPTVGNSGKTGTQMVSDFIAWGRSLPASS